MNSDGDGTGSEVAMAHWLRDLGIEAWIVNPTPYPSSFEFLLSGKSRRWVLPAGEADAEEACASADMALVLDTGEVHRIGRVRPMISHLKTVVVDHHPPGDRPIEGLSFRDPGAAATGEMVWDILMAAGEPISAPALKAIYIALLTDTGSFRFSNATPGAFTLAAELVARGVDPEDAHNDVYGHAPLRRFKLLQACLETLEAEPGLAWMTVPTEVYRELGCTPDDLEGLVDYPRAIEGTRVALLFRGTKQGATKISFRANGAAVDVNALAREFGGGGHVRASGALIEGPIREIAPRVIEAARRAVARS